MRAQRASLDRPSGSTSVRWHCAKVCERALEELPKSRFSERPAESRHANDDSRDRTPTHQPCKQTIRPTDQQGDNHNSNRADCPIERREFEVRGDLGLDATRSIDEAVQNKVGTSLHGLHGHREIGPVDLGR
jgi:hypothetical protein